jgi:phenylacetate-CoA ligase
MVRHAATRVPYYRELFRKFHLDPQDIRTASDLQHVPVTGKAELQARPVADFLAEGVDPTRVIRLSTSGSTGQPTAVMRSQREQYMLQAIRLRSQMLNGLRTKDLRLSVGSRWLRKHPLDRLGLFRMRHTDGANFRELVALLHRLEPDVVMARPSVLQQIAQEAARTSTVLPTNRITFVGGELLTQPVRALVESTWGCRVFNEYASNELSLMASECRHCGTLHTVDDAVVLEILDGDRAAAPGETGRVVGTGLHSFSMPFIRFDFGDIARRPIEASNCPVGFSSVEVIEGREMEFLQLPDGGALSPYTLQRTIQAIPGVGRFRVQQDSRDRVTVLIEHSSSEVLEVAKAARRQLQSLFPAAVELVIETVGKIESPTSKFRYIRSTVD